MLCYNSVYLLLWIVDRTQSTASGQRRRWQDCVAACWDSYAWWLQHFRWPADCQLSVDLSVSQVSITSMSK